MSFKCYRVRKFLKPQENIFFRIVSNELQNAFQNVSGLHVLIGNLGIDGAPADALFISNERIIIIDFKDYTGELSLLENGPWKITTKVKELEVKGGSYLNPFIQANEYRGSLITLLEKHSFSYLEGTHSNFKLGQISCMILFHKPISYRINDIPGKMSPYFYVEDNTTYIEKIKDIISSGLKLSDKEIMKILAVLGLGEDSLYDKDEKLGEEGNNSIPLDPFEKAQIKSPIQENYFVSKILGSKWIILLSLLGLIPFIGILFPALGLIFAIIGIPFAIFMIVIFLIALTEPDLNHLRLQIMCAIYIASLISSVWFLSKKKTEIFLAKGASFYSDDSGGAYRINIRNTKYTKNKSDNDTAKSELFRGTYGNIGDTFDVIIHYINKTSRALRNPKVRLQWNKARGELLLGIVVNEDSSRTVISDYAYIIVNKYLKDSKLTFRLTGFEWDPIHSNHKTMPFNQNGSELTTKNGFELGDIPGMLTGGIPDEGNIKVIGILSN